MVGAEFAGSEALELKADANVRTVVLRASYNGVRQKFAYLSFVVRALIEALVFRPNAVYASDWMTCPIGLTLWVLGLPVIYHEHDAPVAPRGWKRLPARARVLLARRATMCIAPNEGRARVLTQDTGRQNVAVAWNCPARHEAKAARKPRTAGRMVIHYHGHLSQEGIPFTLLHALAMLPEVVSLRATGFETVGTLGYVEQFRALAASLNLRSRVEIRGAMRRDRLLDECATADVGFACTPTVSPNINYSTRVGASNKVFDYMACGLPVLVTDLAEWRAAFVANGYGLACDPTDAASIASALRWFLSRPDEAYAMGERGRQRILSDWNYETQFQPVMDRISKNAFPRLVTAVRSHAE
jgi:glycosyltransferase involved in cell wall biosynthesis